MSGQIDDFELMKLVKACPILYDKNRSRGLQHAKAKDEAWKELSLKLNASEHACITRWKSIRDRFGKEYRRLHDSLDNPTNWKLFPHLLFLKEHYKHGNANNEAIVSVRYEPKMRKRQHAPSFDTSDDGDNFNVDEMIFHQQLIGLVKEYPVLYDKQKIRDSKNLTAKHNAWTEIAETLCKSDEECYKSWKKLRDRFAREIRRHKLKPTASVTWTYFKDMLFLEPHYRKGKPLSIDTEKLTRNTQQNELWHEEFPYDCIEEIEDETEMSEPLQDVNLFEEQSNQPASQSTNYGTQIIVGELKPPSSNETEVKLQKLICGLENVLQQAKDCLKSLKPQIEHLNRQSKTTYSSMSPNTERILSLLNGLSDEHRSKAEQKIVQFLGEQQIVQFLGE